MELFTDYIKEPVGLDAHFPRFSWICGDFVQTAYRIQVLLQAENPDGGDVLCWDSGRVDSNETVGIRYAGAALEADRRYAWRVRLYGAQGETAQAASCFQTGMLDESWPASWIMTLPDGEAPDTDSSPLLRRTFAIEKPLRRATAFVYTNGFYELYGNGIRAGKRQLAPAVAPSPDGETEKRFFPYDVQDMTPLLHEGVNVVGLWLGDGYNENFNQWGWRYAGAKKALFLLSLWYADGSHAFLASDSRWTFCRQSPIIHNGIYAGEWYDASLEKDWLSPDFNDAWEPVFTAEPPAGRLVSCLVPPIMAMEEIHPVQKWQTPRGSWILDMGQNFAGVVRLRVRGEAGRKVILRHAEDITAQGELDVYTNRAAAAADTYVLSGKGTEVYQPRFTYHGFRYVELENYPGIPESDAVVGVALHASVEETGRFITNNAPINRLYQNIRWSIRSNMMSYPTDCPCRDERTPCLMDSAVYEETALHIFQMHAYYQNWLRSILGTARTPDWSGDQVLLCHHLWRYYGDTAIVEECYPAIRRYLFQCLEMRDARGLIPKNFGDWAAPSETGSFDESFADVAQVNTALLAHLLELGAALADCLRQPDADAFRIEAAAVRQAYVQAFYEAEQGRFGETLTPNLLALAFRIGNEEQRNAARRYVLQDLEEHAYTSRTGIYGTRYFLDALLAAGEADAAYRVLTATVYPSFGWQIEQGATTLWEQWQKKGGMQTHNHAMFAGIGTAFFTFLAGIQPLEAGYRSVRIAPCVPGGLQTLDCSVKAVRGRIAVQWAKEADRLVLTIHTPPSMSLELIAPFTKEVRRLSGGRHTVCWPLPKES